jgi:hypothetical protein
MSYSHFLKISEALPVVPSASLISDKPAFAIALKSVFFRFALLAGLAFFIR